jgi:hypothetical protein
VIAVELVYVIDAMPQRQERRDDCTCARTEDQIEPLAQETSEQGLNFLQNAEAVEALGTPSIKGKDPVWTRRIVARSSHATPFTVTQLMLHTARPDF